MITTVSCRAWVCSTPARSASGVVSRRVVPWLVVNRLGGPDGRRGGGTRGPRRRGDVHTDGDVEGTATEVDPPRLP